MTVLAQLAIVHPHAREASDIIRFATPRFTAGP